MDHPIVTLAEAKAQGLTRYYTGKPCSRGHVAERRTSTRQCCECAKLYSSQYRQTPEGKAKTKEYTQSEQCKESQRAYAQSAKGKENKLRQGKKYAAANPHVHITNNVARKYPAAIVPLTEAEQASLRWFYATARELTKRTGRKYEVDHCFPLNLGGIHHPLNLMILPTWANRKKHDKYQPDNPLAVRGLHLKARLSLRIQQP